MTYDEVWQVVPDTGERVLVHRDDGRVIEFTDDLYAPEQEIERLGIAAMFSEEDIKRMLKEYTEYQILSGGG